MDSEMYNINSMDEKGQLTWLIGLFNEWSPIRDKSLEFNKSQMNYIIPLIESENEKIIVGYFPTRLKWTNR